jgi:glycosyltransferase involved in cell wall biosynthesis
MTGEEAIEISDGGKLPTSPVVSVLMIAYNHERYISQAIRSILEQKTSFPFELVIGEDCSADGTREIVRAWQRDNPERIRVIYSEKNVGANKNFARTYASCRGSYIAICEGDDAWGDSTKLEKQVNLLQNNTEYVVSYHDALVIDDAECLISQSKLPNIHKRNHSSRQMKEGAFLLTLTMCFRKIFSDFPEEFYRVLNADTFLISLLSSGGGGYYHHDIKPAKYRQHAGGVWSSLSDHEKLIKQTISLFWLASYWSRVGDKSTSRRILVARFVELAKFCGVFNTGFVFSLIRRFMLR